MCVKTRVHSQLLPAVQFFRRKWFEEFRPYLELSFPSSRLALSPFVLNRYQPHDRLLPPGNDNFLALASPFNQPRKFRLRLVDRNCFILAKTD